MYIEFPAFEYPVVFHERDNLGYSSKANINMEMPLSEERTSRKLAAMDSTVGQAASSSPELKFTVVHDPEALRKDNPVENKYLKLMRYNRGLLDKDLKPDQKERNQLKVQHSDDTTKICCSIILPYRGYSTIQQLSNLRPKRKNSCGNSDSS